MIYKVYSMRDKHVGFTEPKLDMNDNSAIRNFTMAINNADVNNILGFAPSDFDLYCLGEFDTEKGIFTCGIPEFLVNGASLVGDKYAEKN